MEVGNEQHDHEFGKGAHAAANPPVSLHDLPVDAGAEASHGVHEASHGLFQDVAHDIGGTGLDALDAHHDPVDHSPFDHETSIHGDHGVHALHESIHDHGLHGLTLGGDEHHGVGDLAHDPQHDPGHTDPGHHDIGLFH